MTEAGGTGRTIGDRRRFVVLCLLPACSFCFFCRSCFVSSSALGLLHLPFRIYGSYLSGGGGGEGSGGRARADLGRVELGWAWLSASEPSSTLSSVERLDLDNTTLPSTNHHALVQPLTLSHRPLPPRSPCSTPSSRSLLQPRPLRLRPLLRPHPSRSRSPPRLPPA